MEDSEKQAEPVVNHPFLTKMLHQSSSEQSTTSADQDCSAVIKSLDEVKSPFETEAEATILRAIEQNERDRADSAAFADTGGGYSANNNILAGVPAKAMHLFEEDSDRHHHHHHAVEDETNQKAHPSPSARLQLVVPPDADSSAATPILPQIQIEPSSERPTLKDIAARMRLMETTSTEQPSSSSSPSSAPTTSRPSFKDIATKANIARMRQNVETNSMDNETSQPSAKTTFKDIATKANMMRMYSKKMSDVDGSNHIERAETGVIQGENDNEIDPESLALQNQGMSMGEEVEEADEEQVDGSGHHSTSRAKRIYRSYCFPCYAFTNFLYLRRKDIKYGFMVFSYLMIPLLGLSAVLFYFAGNPIGPLGASYSWWLQFFVRQSVTFMLAQVTQFILIDFIALETRLAVLAIGRMFTLMAMQAKGWPILFVFWSLWDFGLIQGSPRSNHHWLHWQNKLDMFNENNPSGSVVENSVYTKLLASLIVIGVVVMIKRVLIALVLGKKKYVTYSSEMTTIMRRVLLVSEVALLAEDIAANPPFWAKQSKATTAKMRAIQSQSPAGGWLLDNYNYRDKNAVDEEDDDDSAGDGDPVRKDSDLYEITEMDDEEGDDGKVYNPNTKAEGRESSNLGGFRGRLKLTKRAFNKSMKDLLSDEEQKEIENLLGEWEEPEIKKKASWKGISINEILQFRETLHFMDGTHPLSVPFGRADTRKTCMVSAQRVYRRLLMKTPESKVLHIDTIMVLALDADGKLKKDKARALIRLFRPDRQGNLTLLDFVRSCDSLYKRLKTFQVSTSNAAQLDDAFEQLGNILFYFILSLVILSVLGVDPTQMFLSLTGLLLPLSFLFSSSASKYFEGLLLVVARQPYDIGDRIAVSNPMLDSCASGSMTWFVEHITLYTTTVRLAATNEVATYSNGSLANLRIINAKRSPQAIVSIKLKFGINVPYQKVKTFGDVVESFVKDRPREWLKMLAFRATVVQADLGYIEYVVVLQHMESWQNIGDVLQSQANVASFCLEVSKKMDMRFIAPPMPVDLSITKFSNSDEDAILSAARTHQRFPSNIEDEIPVDHRKLDKIQSLFKTPEPVSKNKKKK